MIKARQYGHSAVACICILVVSFCVRWVTGPTPSAAIQVASASVPSGPHLGSGLAFSTAMEASVKQQQAVGTWNAAVWKAAVDHNNYVRWIEYFAQRRTDASRAPPRSNWHSTPDTSSNPSQGLSGPSVAVNFGNLSGVVACIKAHESGNYTEQSHIYEGSGAYQFIPGTWRHYSTLAGFPGYAYAYQAPPSVQDAVVLYTLTHGGAHNWDPAYGNDPCTVGLP